MIERILHAIAAGVDHEDVRLELEDAECLRCGKDVGVGVKRTAHIKIAPCVSMVDAVTYDCWECYDEFDYSFESVESRKRTISGEST